MRDDTREKSVDSEQETEKHYGTLKQKIDSLNFSDKLQLALTGSWSERSILIRDKNKTLSSAVLKSPRLSDQEIAAIAQMRDVDVEILREIGKNRQWAKNYPVVVNLTSNPKTPITVSLSLLPRLTARDLKALKLNKNIPEAVSRKASRQLAFRMGGQKAKD